MRKIILTLLSIHLLALFTLLGEQQQRIDKNARSDLSVEYYSLEAQLTLDSTSSSITGACALDVHVDVKGPIFLDPPELSCGDKLLTAYQSKRLDHILNYFHSGLAPPMGHPPFFS